MKMAERRRRQFTLQVKTFMQYIQCNIVVDMWMCVFAGMCNIVLHKFFSFHDLTFIRIKFGLGKRFSVFLAIFFFIFLICALAGLGVKYILICNMLVLPG